MNMRITEEGGIKAAMILALIVMGVALVFLLVIPMPNTRGIQPRQLRQESQVLDEITSAKKGLAASQAVIDAQTWKGDADEVGPGALQMMNALAAKHQVKLSGFRPERTSQASGLDLLPFAVTAEGSYLNVVGFLHAIDDPGNKLAVDLVQIASSEANGDQVTATIGITAYHVTEAPKHA